MPKILIVVDEETMARWLPAHFAEAGWEVTLARDEGAVLASFEEGTQERPPDAAIVDAVLGPAAGFALIQDIKRRSPGTFVVCASARAGGVARLKALAAGADAYITKPFTLADLDRLLGEKCEAT